MKILPESAGKRAATMFLLVFAIALGTRYYLVRNVKTCLDGDESVSCVLAYHIESRGERPLFPYGLRYNGAGAVEAYFAAGLDRLAGRDIFNMLIIPAIEFAIFAGLAGILAMRAGGPLFGFLLGLHIVFSPQFQRTSLRLSGYGLTLAAMLLCAYAVLSMTMGEEETGGPPAPGIWHGAIIGLISGVSVWFHEFSAICVAALFIAAALRWRKKALPVLIVWALTFPIGAAPVVLSYIKYGVNGVHQITQKVTIIGQLPPGPWWRFFTYELPSFFKNENWGSYTHGVPWSAWLLFAATMLGCAAALPSAVDISKNSRAGQILRFSAIYGFMFIFVYLLSPYRGDTPRHLLGLEPFMSVAACAGILSLFRRPNALAKTAAAVLVASFLIADINGTAFALRDDTVWDGNQDVSCKRVDNMMDTLAVRNISNVYTSAFLKWIILCRGEEIINAADVGLIRDGTGRDKWSEYEEKLESASNPAFLFNSKDLRLPWLLAYLREHKTPLRLIDDGEYVLVNPGKRVARKDFMDWSFKTHEVQEKKR